MEPKEFDIEFPRGDTCPLSMTLTDADGNVLIPTAGDEIYFTVKKSYMSQNSVLQKKYTNGDFTIDNGMIRFVLSHEDTASLDYGNYNYDIQFKSSDYVKTILKGSITLTEEATWINNE